MIIPRKPTKSKRWKPKPNYWQDVRGSNFKGTWCF